MSLPVSFLIHIALLSLLALASQGRPLAPRPTRPIEVELITQLEFEDEFEVPPEAPITPLTAPEKTNDPEAAPPSPTDGMTKATELLANRVLSDPKNAQVRETLPQLDSSERIIQLCTIEGLEQLRIARPGTLPDSIAPSAFAQITLQGLTLDAKGAAFRAARLWYGLAYNCTVEPDFTGVAAFAFKDGPAIPQDQWEAHDLIAEDEDE